MDSAERITIAISVIGSGTLTAIMSTVFLRRIRQDDERDLKQFQHDLDSKLENLRAQAERKRQKSEFELRRLPEASQIQEVSVDMRTIRL